MFISIGKKNTLGKPIVHDHIAISQQAIFDLLSVKAVGTAPILSGEEWQGLHSECDQLADRLRSTEDGCAEALQGLWADTQAFIYAAMLEAYKMGFQDSEEYQNDINQMMEQQANFLSTCDKGA